ncbi:MAG: hypothetical protein COV30_00130 [Candidatus Yanofskybacteria bacterium CG10_big_fil_rev_8_21_14_0_10_37_15]|uniref:Transglycosylase SLT domain-containing protein n=1 Tax=Candidatus Yanofskybacteria bacterium CG10_big_fil_rev_8_21_14_0_10_37_15 TaxID=1975097 RepID=A0A2H0R6F8_9BACT|nr:MAG: hypothetical protein COV30_00130 [Candidatus Yanofskybacteria bacterium CG10_big_fil_rev_8_21_14_0_10_37_15]
MKISKKIIILLTLVFVLFPLFADAVSWLPIVPCGTSSNPQECTRCDLFKLFKNIIDFLLYGFMPPVAAILFVWGGFLILMGGASPGNISRGKSIFWNTFLGVLIMLSSWLITNTIIKSLADESITNPNVPWYQFECKETVRSGEQPPIVSNPPEDGGDEGICSFGGINLCQPRQMSCGASKCDQYVSAINQYAGRTGVANGANFLKAIMIKESACNAEADSGHAKGIMQLKPSTANIYKNRCGVSGDTTAQWLKDNPELSICIAAEYIKSLSGTSCGNTPRNIAAGYNGGAAGACGNSVDCAGETSCDGSPVKRWECLYDDSEHNVCNTGYDETRDYATKVIYCYNNPGF